MEFRSHKITRTCTKNYQDYTEYKPYLAKDFNHRCAYCNLRDDFVTSYFEIDHFVPRAEIRKHKELESLEKDYKNLIYACHNCNGEKSDLFEGDIESNPYENLKFYDPTIVDFNTIFYRNEIGTISSDDNKGKSMILDLKLYRPLNNLAWLCEQLNDLVKKIHAKLDMELDEKKKNHLKDALNELMKYYIICSQIHTANYNNKSFSIKDINL